MCEEIYKRNFWINSVINESQLLGASMISLTAAVFTSHENALISSSALFIVFEWNVPQKLRFIQAFTAPLWLLCFESIKPAFVNCCHTEREEIHIFMFLKKNSHGFDNLLWFSFFLLYYFENSLHVALVYFSMRLPLKIVDCKKINSISIEFWGDQRLKNCCSYKFLLLSELNLIIFSR